MSTSKPSMALDDTMMFVLFDRVRRAEREGRRASKAELLKDLDAETEARRAESRSKDRPRHKPDALKSFLRLYCETTGVIELTAHARKVKGKIAVEVTESR
ncbi:MAG: hypothetical protein HY318_04715 [Armatimonadetes bacterium]|nr:hypothetical protein [Armatimonadota bacterium]